MGLIRPRQALPGVSQPESTSFISFRAERTQPPALGRICICYRGRRYIAATCTLGEGGRVCPVPNPPGASRKGLFTSMVIDLTLPDDVDTLVGRIMPYI